MTLFVVDPAVDPRWPALLALYPEAGLFHSPPWLRAIADTYGFTIQARIATGDGGVPQAGMLFCELSDLLGARIVSLPFSDACDPLVASPREWGELFAPLAAEGRPVLLRCLNDQIAQADGRLSVTKRARWHSIPLAPTAQAQRAALFGPTRSALARAERAGLEVRPLEEVAAFHELHVALRKRKYRMLAQPLEFFENLASRFQEVGGWHPLGVFREGQLLAATIYLRWGKVLYYKFNASALHGLELRPNNLLVWSGLELARSLGCTRLDFGPSDDDQPGLIHFKRGFGATEQELRFLRYTPPGWVEAPVLEARAVLTELTSRLTAPEVPEPACARAGAGLYRFFG